MLELILIYAIAKNIAKKCKEKGRIAAGWVILFIVSWVGGEFTGGIVGVLLNGGELGPAAYLCALLGAASGAIISFVIVNNLPAIRSEEDYYRGDDAPGVVRIPDAAYGEKFGDFREGGSPAPYQGPAPD